MPRKSIKNSKMFQILDEDGGLHGEIPEELDQEKIKKIYETMVLARTFDQTALSLQREGRMLTYASLLGQEAQVGAAFALGKDDWFVPSFREHGIFIAREYPMSKYFLYWMGDGRGMEIPENVKCTPVSVPVASQILHGVGIAWSMKMKNQKNFVEVFFGDGATSEGDFHEGLNWAGVFKAPCVFICQNNQWAISLPRSKQTASETIAQKANAYGFDGVQVDGNDVFAVYKVIKDAAEKATSGKGPTLVEMFTYRMSDHTTSDDAKKYRSSKEVEEWKKKDPVDRMKKFLMKKNWLTEEEDKKIHEQSQSIVDAAVKEAESIQPQKPTEMFTNMYAEIPENLKEQMGEVDNAGA